MTQHQLLKLDMTKREDSAQVLPQVPLLTSQQAGWSDIFLTYYHHPGRETCEHLMRQLVLEITDIDSWASHERRLDGQFKSYRFGNGELGLCPPNTSHWTVWNREFHFTLILFEPQMLERVAHESVNGDRLELIPRFQFTDPVIQQIASALKADLSAGCPAGRLYGESFGAALAVHLLTTCSTLKHNIQTYSDGLPKHKLQQATDYIQAHLDRDIKLVDLANTVGISQYYFCRLFKQSMHMTPHQYVIRQRVEHALQLLKRPDLSIADVAFQCGFAHQSHLSRHFRRLVGVSPKTFQEK